ncbi:hypothetical protein NL676_018020 [Syzygium grande]|nr:hypothetical protein NL676_018020 [Syzygium grande]
MLFAEESHALMDRMSGRESLLYCARVFGAGGSEMDCEYPKRKMREWHVGAGDAGCSDGDDEEASMEKQEKPGEDVLLCDVTCNFHGGKKSLFGASKNIKPAAARRGVERADAHSKR